MKFYVDTLVWGGYYDNEFSEQTIPFIEQAKQGRFTIVLSDVTLDELQNAPEKVQDLPATIPQQFIEPVTITPEQFMPAEHYITEDVLTQKFYSDAQSRQLSGQQQAF